MKLPVPPLNLRVATPCHAKWAEMEGDQHARFCGQCRKHVYNLSTMSAAAAADLIRAKEGKLCIRFYHRADGTVLHGEDCPVGLIARQWRRTRSLAGAFASLILMTLGLGRSQAQSAQPSPISSDNVIMGAICPLPASPTPAPTPKPSPPKKSSH